MLPENWRTGLQERNSIEKDSNNNTPYAVGNGSICSWLRHRECDTNDNKIGEKTMTAYEAMLKSKEDAAGIMTSLLVMVLEGITEKEIPEGLRITIFILAREAMDSEVKKVE